MNRKNIRLIITLMTIALVGVIAMQYFYIKHSLYLKSQLFDESVHAALNSVALKAEKNEALNFINAKQMEAEEKRRQKELELAKAKERNRSSEAAERMRIKSRQLESAFNESEAKIKRRFPNAVRIDNDFFETYMRDPVTRNEVKYEISTQNVINEHGQLYQQKDVILYVDQRAEHPKKAKDDSVRYFVLDPISGPLVITLPPKIDKQLEEEIHRLEQEAKAKKAATFMDSVRTGNPGSSTIESLADEFERSKRSLKQRIDPRFIENELKAELHKRSIKLPFNFSIQSSNTGKTVYQFAQYDGQKQPASEYATLLFPTDVGGNTGILQVTFPGKARLLQGNVKAMLLLSFLLLLVLVCCFAYTILTIFKQKKISEMKTDFINNMTHEFKTPVATIMIASESLKDPEIAQEKSRIERLANIIYDENIRLGNHIERVLNIAKLEKGELQLTLIPVDMNDLVAAVLDSMELQFQKANADIALSIKATASTVYADEFHMSNVLFNLLDNALKYSKERPQIAIRTESTAQSFHLYIRDKGIGMNKDQLSKIFEQFYRIPTGNVHDVKGFGLGLSYVHDIIKRLKGSVKVRSELHKGTEFEIVLPLLKE